MTATIALIGLVAALAVATSGAVSYYRRSQRYGKMCVQVADLLKQQTELVKTTLAEHAVTLRQHTATLNRCSDLIYRNGLLTQVNRQMGREILQARLITTAVRAAEKIVGTVTIEPEAVEWR
ncbi:MAG TPA: hypothetical protein VH088_07730 [Terriglobales bacterium]|jgi:hypothetical protein|nr:hypothetical protein [Terriglobales bacterium]